MAGRFGWFAGIVLGIALLAPGARADAAGAEEREYNRAVEQAVERFRARDFASARELFERAHSLNPSARTLRSLGLTDFESGRYTIAIRELQAALTDERRPLDPQQRAEVQAVIEHARGFVGQLDVHLTPAEASLSVDAVEVAAGPLELDAGSHLLRAKAPGYVDGEWRFEVRPGETTTAALTLEPLPPPEVAQPTPVPAAEPYDPTQRTAAWIVGGVGAAGVIVGGVFGVLSLVKHNQSNEYCGDDGLCSDPRGVEAMDAARAAGDVSTVAFVVGGVALGAAAVLLLTAPGRPASEQPLSLRVSPAGAILHGVF